MVDDKLSQDEAERAASYEAVKSDARAGVESEIAARANRPGYSQAERVEEVAAGMRRTAVDEVVETQGEVERARVAARVSQIVDYIFFLIYALLTLRLLLELFAARESAGFFRFIKTLTDPFYYPFRGLMPSISSSEGFTLVLSLVAALVAYMILHLAINGLLRIVAHRKVAI